ncbi:nitrogen regulation protein NR(I) [Chitinimonas taiwanensis]|uniref:DNA-binding transcriptional regulator NtrC n=1 Tax=Chitinimonas taiwanensis DSM 18899 TaxID=1121279 RepID=A0A1K2H518_9NEIS|nr:nitrogen regulation protein NR(I) [Chitinimonas taiwanensis]SFZ70249.1 two-component system, NtrC family, nitrogen regulation response regulator GlnG [Chitinimonas taiwanensis DSM 18899]
MKPVWIIDDDRSIRWVFEKALAREGIAFHAFSAAAEALDALKRETPAVVVSDIRMPGESGLDLLGQLKERFPRLPVIIMTAHSDLESAVAAFQGGAFEYLPKPFDVDHAVELIRRAMDESLKQEVIEAPLEEAPEILGQAPAMQEVFRAIGRLSQSAATVMITGESGAGKELVARALHRHSPRSGKPFVAINTAAIPKDLLESELFGHERGSFTGAQNQRTGRFEQAEGGTLFLDEIGDMPAELQTRLLRVLSDGYFYRVGGHAPIKANVRVIAATHQALEDRVKNGLFREDLFHRLNVIRLRLPALRERREDIPVLARHFLAKSARELGVEVKRLTEDAMRVLAGFEFPGNVRQLENLCHWITVMAPGQAVGPADLPPELKGESAQSSGGGDWAAQLAGEADRRLRGGERGFIEELTHQFERTLILRALAATGGKRIEAAERLGLGRNTLTRKIQELDLEREIGGE